MQTGVVDIPVEHITNWDSFHDVFQQALGFPEIYGRNMNAWIDCLTSADREDHGMMKVTVRPGELLTLRINDAADFRQRCPEEYAALVECAAFVNYRRMEVGEPPVIALLLCGWFRVSYRQTSDPTPQVRTYACRTAPFLPGS
jgi:RNAse (barnase) inhibitor barstar